MNDERDDVGTVEDLHESATRVTGLADFGGDEHVEALGVLLDSYRREAGLTPRGNKIKRAFLRGALTARLLGEQAFARHPEHAEVPVERPIFVTGLPRTGTTALHRLLTADPAHQGLEVWLAEVPQPRPPRETWAEDPVFQAIQRSYAQQQVERPEFMGLHYMSAEQVEECWQLLRQSIRSVSYECLAHVPSYSAWLAGQDWTPAYRRHKRNLQLIGLPDAGRRWVLKNPSHLFALDALLAVYPDAIVIQTHRDPAVAMASMCSLADKATEGWSTTFRGSTIGRDQLELWARGLESFTTARRRHPAAQFYDVHYDDFVTDPVGTAERIYRRFSLPLDDAARAAMHELHASSTTGIAKPRHSYHLADFGLTAGEVAERFAATG
ncbi:sulfotransferase family protein [Saccharopolyspora griseoalba]|uniref:Sulfotransferase family protein n=1 Tax=Saccharopolyspora griseoalba TaxID=1431848 RepID=A0ABW2LJR4_9PSEU